jgi:hypothetical protein
LITLAGILSRASREAVVIVGITPGPSPPLAAALVAGGRQGRGHRLVVPSGKI